MQTKITDELVNFIAEFEGFSSRPYICPAGKLTIGYGHVIKKHETFTEISQSEGLELLKSDIMPRLEWVYKNLPEGLKQHQYDAVTSFVFNLGAANYKSSTLIKRINNGSDPELIEEAFMMWNKAKVNGKLQELRGLTRRRQREAKLYNEGVYNG